MIHSAGLEASAVQEASKLMSESLAGSITIGDMRIDDKGNIQYKDNSGNWTTVISSSPTISSIKTRGSDGEYQNYAIKDTVSHYLDLNGLREYDKKIKEYIDARIDEKLNSFNEPHNKYKIITGED